MVAPLHANAHEREPAASIAPVAPSPPIHVAVGQERASLDGRYRIRVKRRGGTRDRPLFLVAPLTGGAEPWHTPALIEREWPLVVDSAAPWARPAAPPDARVSQLLAGRDPLLGVAGSYSEHAAAGARKRAGRPATKARRGRAGA